MTIEELEKYCVQQATECRKKETEYRNSKQLYASQFSKGEAHAYTWIAAVIQQNKERITPH
jgi:hypothetical protein